MSIDTLVGNSDTRPLARLATYSRYVIESAVPGMAMSAGATIVGNLFFGIADTFGAKPGPMDMNSSLLYMASITPLTIQFFYQSFMSSRKQRPPELCYGPHLPHGYQTVYEILHGSAREDTANANQELATVYPFPQEKKSPAA